MALRYRRLPSDQLPRLLGAALRAGATEEEGNGPSQAQAQAQAQQCVGHGRGATIRAYGSSDVRVPSILSAVRGDERSVRILQCNVIIVQCVD